MNEFLRSKSPREKMALGSAGFVILAAAVFVLLTEPGTADWRRSRTRLDSAIETYRDVVKLAAEAASLEGAPASVTGSLPAGATLMSLLDATAGESGIAANVKRIVPGSEGEASIVFESVPFDELMSWLVVLKDEYGISVQQFNANPASASGRTNASVVLVAP